MRARPSRSVWIRQSEQPPRRRCHVARLHQRLADQETARPGCRQPVEIGGVVNAALADDRSARRHQRRKLFGGAKIDLQTLEIAVVDADQAAIQPQRAV
jgi:hypothetical protein